MELPSPQAKVRATRGGDGAAEFFGGFDPFLNDGFYVGESFFVGLLVVGAARKFGDFGDKRFDI